MTKPAKKRAKRQTQVEKDNARVPRDWGNDPAWLRDLLLRTWEALGDDMDCVFRIGEPDGLTHREFDLLCGQVGFVLNEHSDSEKAMDLASRYPVDA